MKDILKPSQQHRYHIGEHVTWLQKRQGSQKLQHQYIQHIAARPGCHSDNVKRKNIAHAMLQLCSILTSVRNSNTTSETTVKNTNILTGYGESNSINKYHYEIQPKFNFLPNKYTMQYSSPPTIQIKSIAIMINSISHFIYEAGEFISRNDPLRISMVAASPIVENQQDSLIRINRYAIPQRKKTTPAPMVDDVKIVKLYDYSCLNEGVNLSFSEILKHISLSLLQPITMLTMESINIDSWNKRKGCPEVNEIKKISEITQKIDNVVSQITNSLPNSKPLTIIQYIIAPLLERIADDLTGKPVSRELEFALLQQIAQQARISIAVTNQMEQMRLDRRPTMVAKKSTLGLPIFYIMNGVNHIDLVRKKNIYRVPIIDTNGKLFAIIFKSNKDKVRNQQVYFNYLTQTWKITGNGRFNRFSDKERRLVYKYSIGIHYLYRNQLNSNKIIYTVINPYSFHSEKLSAIEMFGQLVPCRYQSEIKKWFIYDAAEPDGQVYEVILARSEWHLKLPVEQRVKFEILFSPEYGRDLKVDIVEEVNKKKIYAQINTDAGFLWGKKFFRNKHGHLELLSPDKKNDKYHKNTIMNSSMFEKNKITEHEIKNQENNDDVMSYERANGCFRVKRGMKLSHMCIETDVGKTSQFENVIKFNKYPIIAEGSIGIVYDCLDGTVIKKYKGKIDERHKSRLISAKNNAKGFNRLYGPSSATISTTSNDNGSVSVFVKLKKIPGIPLDLIRTITDVNMLNAMMRTIKNGFLAQELSLQLKNLGIVHHDINKGNIIYDIEKGFSVIDFDSANFLPDGDKVSPEITMYMERRFKYVFNDALRDINAQRDELNKNMKRKRISLTGKQLIP